MTSVKDQLCHLWRRINSLPQLRIFFKLAADIFGLRRLNLFYFWLSVRSPFAPPEIRWSSLSVRLHAQFSRITAIVRLCYSIRQLRLSEHTWDEKIGLLGRSMLYPGTTGGAVSISTSGKRNTSSWPLYITSNKLPRHSRKMAYEEWDEATSLYISYMVYIILHKLDTLSCGDFGGKTSLSASASFYCRFTALGKKSRACTEHKISSDLMERIRAGVMRLSIE